MSCVDVVIPCYKYAHFLRACVRSVLDQAGVNVRILIIDDCSPDHTPQVGAELAAEDARVEFRRHQVNQGHIATYNEGLLGWAKSEYSLLLSADDMLAPGALGRATTLMDAYPEVGLTYGKAINTTAPELEIPPMTQPETGRVLSGPEFLEIFCSDAFNIVPTPTAVVRTKVQQAVGGYRKDLPHTGDMEMWLRFGAYGAVGVFDALQAYYRLHGQNMSVQYAGVKDLKEKQAAFDTLFTLHAARIPKAARLRRLARRSLAENAFWIASKRFDAGQGSDLWRPYLECALDMDPRTRLRPRWLRFQAKRLLGPKFWSALRPVVGRIRGRHVVA